MTGPKSVPVLVNGTEYKAFWYEESGYQRFTAYLGDRSIGSRKLPITVDQGIGMTQYLVKAFLVGSWSRGRIKSENSSNR